MIYEMPIYDGGLKVWRVLNLQTGTFYCLEYKTEALALASIKQGELRDGKTVCRIRVQDLYQLLPQP